jgi:hypothetical protein
MRVYPLVYISSYLVFSHLLIHLFAFSFLKLHIGDESYKYYKINVR